MVVSIIGCGSTAKDWFNTPCDLSIGVNDSRKWGRDTDWLVVVNRHFEPVRDHVIKSSMPKRFLTNSAAYWPKFFTEAEVMRMQPYGKHMKKGHVYSSKTSPFVAMSLAFNAHADTIILHGVDMVSHPNITGKALNYELRQYERFCRQLNEFNTKVFVSSKESALSKFLPVYSPTLGDKINDISRDWDLFKDKVNESHTIRGILYDSFKGKK